MPRPLVTDTVKIAKAELLRVRLAEFRQKIEEQHPYFIGFPGSVDFEYSELYPFFNYLLNNVGDPYADPLQANHSKGIEKEVVEFLRSCSAPRKTTGGAT